MQAIGVGLMWLGFALLGFGAAGIAVGTVAHIVLLARHRQVPGRVLVAVGLSPSVASIGVQVALVGLVVNGTLPWPFLIASLVFGLGTLIGLQARIDLLRRKRLPTD